MHAVEHHAAARESASAAIPAGITRRSTRSRSGQQPGTDAKVTAGRIEVDRRLDQGVSAAATRGS